MGSEPVTAPRFFVLRTEGPGSRYDVEVDELEPVTIGEGAVCPRCGEPVGMRPRLPPHRVGLSLLGEALGDYVESSGYDLLISERLARAFQEEGLTGLNGFHPVEVVRLRLKRRSSKPSDTPHYQAVTACFGRAAVDLARSRIRYEAPPTCGECRYVNLESIHGFTLEPGSWRGEDIFRPRGLSGRLVVSERFAHFVARHGFNNMRLTPTEELVWDPLELGPASSAQPR